MNFELIILVLLFTIIAFNFTNLLKYSQKISVVNGTICLINPVVFYGYTIQFFGAAMLGQNFMATTDAHTHDPYPTNVTNDYRAINITANLLKIPTTDSSFLTATLHSNKFFFTKH